LNTVVPYQEAAYYKSRTSIGIPAGRVLKVGDEVGLHPTMTGFKDLYDQGLLTIVQGVGYPNPNRSHFKSMDIWHTADTTATGDGWLGRYFDSQCCGYGAGESGQAPTKQAKAAAKIDNTQIGIAMGREAPLAMRGRSIQPIAFESADLFRWTGSAEEKSLTKYYDFLGRTALDAQVSSDLSRKAVATKPTTPYPGGNPLADQLRMVASMIHAKLPTRVYYVTLGGFDTHAGQGGENGNHARLVGQFAAAVKAFYDDLKAQRNDTRVLSMARTAAGAPTTAPPRRCSSSAPWSKPASATSTQA
jgi:uncharacterized protein (DUF1501 family)